MKANSSQLATLDLSLIEKEEDSRESSPKAGSNSEISPSRNHLKNSRFRPEDNFSELSGLSDVSFESISILYACSELLYFFSRE